MKHKSMKRCIVFMIAVLMIGTALRTEVDMVFASSAETPVGVLESDWVMDENNNIKVDIYLNDCASVTHVIAELSYPDAIFSVPDSYGFLGKDAEILHNISIEPKQFYHSFYAESSGKINCGALFGELLKNDTSADNPSYCTTHFHVFTLLLTVKDPVAYSGTEVSLSADFRISFDMTDESDVCMTKSIGKTACSHKWDGVVVSQAAKCETQGVRTSTCLFCGCVKTENIPAIGHKWDGGTATDTGILYVCLNDSSHTITEAELLATVGDVNADGKIDPADARLALRYAVNLEVPDAVQSVAADIDKDGNVTPADARRILRTAVGLDDLLVSHSHEYKTEQIAATCTQAGNRKVFCAICGYVISDQVLPATGHKYTSQIIQEPTCDHVGIEEYTCVRCGDTYTDIVKASHDFVNYYCHNCDVFEDRKFSSFLWNFLHENGEYAEEIYYLHIDEDSDYDVYLIAGTASEPVLVVFSADDGDFTDVTIVAIADTNGNDFAIESIISDSNTGDIYTHVIIAATKEGSLEYTYEGNEDLHDLAVNNALAIFEICFSEVYTFMEQKGYIINVNRDFGVPK